MQARQNRPAAFDGSLAAKEPITTDKRADSVNEKWPDKTRHVATNDFT